MADNEDRFIDFKKEGKIVVLQGRPRSGKSNFMKWLILNNTIGRKNIFKFGLVFTGTPYSNDYDYIPEKYRIAGFNVSILKKYIKKLEDYVKKHKKKPPSSFIIFDDLIGLMAKNEGFLNNLFTIAVGHLNVSIFIACQYLTAGTTTTFRECVNCCLAFGSKSQNTIQSLYENFGQLFPSYKIFKINFMDITKEKYTAMYYDRDEDDIDNNYKCVKAPDMSKYKIKLNY